MWRADKDREPIIGGACHAIDLLRWIAGDPIEGAPFAAGQLGKSDEKSIKHQLKIAINNHNVAAEHKQMYDAVVNGTPLITTGREGARTVAVCRAVVESAKSGMPVKINCTV